jgi:hypothetical protein
MTDPTFTTRAELTAWAVRQANTAQLHAWVSRGDRAMVRDILESSIDEIKRVTLAHIHLGDD